jgi:hypothetical protein
MMDGVEVKYAEHIEDVLAVALPELKTGSAKKQAELAMVGAA